MSLHQREHDEIKRIINDARPGLMIGQDNCGLIVLRVVIDR